MPRYFFHVDNGAFSADPNGTELADLTAAQEAAVILSGELSGRRAWTFGRAAVRGDYTSRTRRISSSSLCTFPPTCRLGPCFSAR